jgi:sec-independent protein translocase protein TatC
MSRERNCLAAGRASRVRHGAIRRAPAVGGRPGAARDWRTPRCDGWGGAERRPPATCAATPDGPRSMRAKRLGSTERRDVRGHAGRPAVRCHGARRDRVSGAGVRLLVIAPRAPIFPPCASQFSVSETEHHPDDPYTPSEALAPPAPREKPMGFWEHLEELRGTIIKSIIAFVICAALIGYFIKEFNQALLWPLFTVKEAYPTLDTNLGTHKIMEVFTMIIQMCVLGGLLLAAPVILYFVGQFVSPALTEREMKAVLPLCISALFLFLAGSSFGFFLLMPKTIEISVQLNETFNLITRWTVGDYYSTLTWLVLGVGAAFEFPLIVVLLVWLGIMTTDFLRKYRRHAIVVIFVIAAIITPTPDPITQTMFAAPLYGLYEIAILVSSRVEKRRQMA